MWHRCLDVIWRESNYSGGKKRDDTAGNVCAVGCLDWVIFQFTYSGHLPAMNNPASSPAVQQPWEMQSSFDHKCGYVRWVISYFTNYSVVVNCCFQVLYFCPGFKTGVKHLYNIISKKKESLKDEGEQKAEKVIYLTTRSFTCNCVNEAVCQECNENLTLISSVCKKFCSIVFYSAISGKDTFELFWTCVFKLECLECLWTCKHKS